MKEVSFKCKLDWVRSFSDLPNGAAIYNENGHKIKDISYNEGIRIEETFKTSLDELNVKKIIRQNDNGETESYYKIFKDYDQNVITVKD